MAKDTRNHAQRRRQEAQQALRDKISAEQHEIHIVEMVDKVRDKEVLMDTEMVARMKIAIDAKFKLLNKYLPDLKSVELTGDTENPLTLFLAELSSDGLPESNDEEPTR